MSTSALRDYLSAAPNVAHLWARLVVEELVRNGAGAFFLGPGSRNTPLAVAVAEYPGDSGRAPRVTVHVDERGGAFAALGAGRASGTHPAVWITTSGTAVANGLPAAVEADAAAVPLLLLTADRPPELRETGANQTIRQPSLFASVVRWAFDVPVPSAEIDPAFVLTTVDHAVARSQRRMGPAGPVHLNVPFREPLAPEPDAAGEAGVAAVLGRLPERWFREPRKPYTHVIPSWSGPRDDDFERLVQRIDGVERGLLTAGPVDPIPGLSLGELAEALGWPLLPDVLSHARLSRHTRGNPNLVPYFDLALASRAFAGAYRPEAVIHVGARPTSKRLQGFVEAARPELYAVTHDGPGRLDPGHRVTHHLQGWTGGVVQDLKDRVRPREGGAWLRAWQTASDAVARILDDVFADDRLTEPRVARLISERIGEGQALFAAASMPIRDLNTFAVPDGPYAFPGANRGASGIDGTVATAVGFGGSSINGPAVLLIGDLALLHDLNSLALLRDGPPLVVVVVNNDGGGIFHFLPVAPGGGAGALPERVFEPYFGAPHGLTFEHAARMFGLEYARPETASAFVEAFEAAQQRPKTMDARGDVVYRHGCSTLIEVRTDRAENAALHRDLAARCARAVEAALGL